MEKSEIGYRIGMIEPHNAYSLYWNSFSKAELLSEYNKVMKKKNENEDTQGVKIETKKKRSKRKKQC